jgi:NAD(P)-dependent dehydrogenase (short-subunit alcohol dehydrogenase family)
MAEATGSRMAVVVGGGSGIGAAVVERQRADGDRVVVWDIAGEFDVRCDVADPDSIDGALAETIASDGLPDQVTITAGVGHSGMLADVGSDEWDRIMAVNARGPWLVLRAFANAMVAAEQPGSLVATSSVSAHLVDRNMGVYCASKAALSMVVQVAAFEWAPHGIRVNAVGPGVTATPMLGGAPVTGSWLSAVADRTPLGRVGEADDIAQAVVALHGLGWVTGQVLDCDGGLSLHSPIDSYAEMVTSRGAPSTKPEERGRTGAARPRPAGITRRD